MLPLPLPLRPIRDDDRAALRAWLEQRWGTPIVQLDGRAIDAAALPGFVADHDDGSLAGLIVLLDEAGHSEVVVLDVLASGIGTGTRLLELAAIRARSLGLTRLLARTTNDNLDALRFYQRRDFRLWRLTPGAIDREREADPEIPLLGHHGIPLRDEISLLRELG